MSVFFYVSWTEKRQIIHNYPLRLDILPLTIKRARLFKTSFMLQEQVNTLAFSSDFAVSALYCVASMLNYIVVGIRKANCLKFKGVLG